MRYTTRHRDSAQGQFNINDKPSFSLGYEIVFSTVAKGNIYLSFMISLRNGDKAENHKT